MSKQSKTKIDYIILSGLILIVLWLVFAFIFNKELGLTGNPTFLQIFTQALPVAIGSVLVFSRLIKTTKVTPLPIKIILVAIYSFVVTFVSYYFVGILLILVYGLNINWTQ